ncbi:AIG2-like protein [Astrocystis sublimbata]|nr:AIG2-like protein [Astrocystis sublimbata]
MSALATSPHSPSEPEPLPAAKTLTTTSPPLPKPKPRPLFIYGTLRALPLLAWALTGDASTSVTRLIQPAVIHGYARFSLKHRDYPAVIKHDAQSSVDGYLLTLETTSQRRKLDDFEGEAYKLESVAVTVLDADGTPSRALSDDNVIEVDVYLWAGDSDELTDRPWELETFEKERLEDWLDLFEGMELVGEDEE